jgi:pimeloyl-ACP methyl ester carboxylesterase
LRVDTRPGVTVPVYTLDQTGAIANIVLYSGGGGGYGQIGEDGWPLGGNFLIRTGKHWATYPFNLVMVGRPSDQMDLSEGYVRIGEKHAADNAAILRSIRQRSPLPIWVVGTSMGTISAAAAAIQNPDQLVAGVVLTSSIVAYKVAGALPRQDLGSIRVPTLVVHHAQDDCWACRPYEAKSLAKAFTKAPVQKIIFVNGGAGATGNPCEPLHHHGFVGMQEEVVDLIAQWIVHPTNE